MWIGDQFAKNKAEQLELGDISKLFSPTPETAILERPTNHFILGAKGSGKTTLLRALTYSVWQHRKGSNSPQFIGVYLPVRFEVASYFQTAFFEIQDSTLFEHFFVTSLLYQICCQLTEANISEKIIYDIVTEHLANSTKEKINDLLSLKNILLREKNHCISLAKNNPSEFGSSNLISKAPLSISSIQYIAEQISNLTFDSKRLCLLIDSFDYYESLTSVLAPLFESDSSNPIVVKAAARLFNVAEFVETRKSRRLEIERDFEIISLDREPDDFEHIKLLTEAICKRARYAAPDEILKLNDNEILSLLFNESTDDLEDLGSFNSFCRLSNGNILQLIILINESAIINKSLNFQSLKTLTPISRASRLAAIRQESAKFWDLEIGVRLFLRELEAKAYCATLVHNARINSNKSEVLLAPSFKFEFIPEEYQSLLSSLLSSRILIAHNPIVHRTLQAGFIYSSEITLELNRLMLDKFSIRPTKGNIIELDTKKFHREFLKRLNDDKPYLSPRAKRSRKELFPNDFIVFISLPFDEKKHKRTSILKKAINAIYKETTGEEGRAGASYIDVHHIPHAGVFKTEIPNFINDSSYVVADISELGKNPSSTGGIFYEIGLALGKKKPLAFFYNCKDPSFEIPPFDASKLPKLLYNQTIIVVDRHTTNFVKIFRRIHEKLIGYNGIIDVPSNILNQNNPYAYLSFQPRNNDAFEWFNSIIKDMLPELTILRAHDWDADDEHSLVNTITNATFCIIDCTNGINNFAIELGICSANDPKKVLEVWDSEADPRNNPISMYPGQRFTWTDLGENDKRKLIEIIKHLTRTTTLGARRL